MKLLAANNAQTVLASGINASATTLSVASGAGSSFPSPASGTSLFKLTLLDAATESLTEIMHVTAVSGDSFTVVRGQEGTTARSWSVNDIVANMVTAGTLDFFAQLDSPAFSGTPTGPTAASNTANTQLATTAFVHQDGVGLAGASSNLKASLSISSSSLGFTADSAIVAESLTGNHYRINNISKVINISTTGLNGMNTGTAPASGWVAIYVVFNPTTGDYGLVAINTTSSVAPNVFGPISQLPGYTASGLISVWRTTSGSIFQFGYQRGRRVSTPRVDVLLTSSNPGGYTAIPLTQAVPQNAVSCRGYAFCNSGSGAGAATLVLAEDTNGAGFLQAYAGTTGAIGSDIYFEMLTPVVQNIFYQFSWTTSGVSNATVGVSGYEI